MDVSATEIKRQEHNSDICSCKLSECSNCKMNIKECIKFTLLYCCPKCYNKVYDFPKKVDEEHYKVTSIPREN